MSYHILVASSKKNSLIGRGFLPGKEKKDQGHYYFGTFNAFKINFPRHFSWVRPSFIRHILLPSSSAETLKPVTWVLQWNTVLKYFFFSAWNSPSVSFHMYFWWFVVPRTVTKYEARIMDFIFCKQGFVVWAWTFANLMDLNMIFTVTPDSGTQWLETITTGRKQPLETRKMRIRTYNKSNHWNRWIFLQSKHLKKQSVMLLVANHQTMANTDGDFPPGKQNRWCKPTFRAKATNKCQAGSTWVKNRTWLMLGPESMKKKPRFSDSSCSNRNILTRYICKVLGDLPLWDLQSGFLVLGW